LVGIDVGSAFDDGEGEGESDHVHQSRARRRSVRWVRGRASDTRILVLKGKFGSRPRLWRSDDKGWGCLVVLVALVVLVVLGLGVTAGRKMVSKDKGQFFIFPVALLCSQELGKVYAPRERVSGAHFCSGRRMLGFASCRGLYIREKGTGITYLECI
jgi:hypothetical protein